jgi:hypothetical protein
VYVLAGVARIVGGLRVQRAGEMTKRIEEDGSGPTECSACALAVPESRPGANGAAESFTKALAAVAASWKSD